MADKVEVGRIKQRRTKALKAAEALETQAAEKRALADRLSVELGEQDEPQTVPKYAVLDPEPDVRPKPRYEA